MNNSGPFAFLYNGGTFTTIDPGAYAYAINDLDQILVSNANLEWFVWSGGTLTSIIYPASSWSVAGINNAGQVVGTYTDPSGSPQGFVGTPTQTITSEALPNQPFGSSPFMVSATASSGLTVRFSSRTPHVCMVSETIVTLAGAGTCTIQATQAGDARYGAAIPVGQSFQVTPEGQTITFGALANQTFGTAPFIVGATASSGLTVTFDSQTSHICTVSGTAVTLVNAGTCTIQGKQRGNTDYAAATPVAQSFLVTPEGQSITFGTLANQPLGNSPFTVSATASSGLAVTFNSLTPQVCTVSGTTVTLLTTGRCTIQARQRGDADYSSATPVDQSFHVTR